MSTQELEALWAAGRECHFAAGERVVRAGDPANSLYFILAGQVDVVVATEDGHQLRLTTLGQGTAFGEIALVNRIRRTADVIAVTEAVCLEVPFHELADELRTRMLLNMVSYLARKIERDTELMRHLG